jgi:hypothetical protein
MTGIRQASVNSGVVRAALEGCVEDGLMVESLGPAADVLPWAVSSPFFVSHKAISSRLAPVRLIEHAKGREMFAAR